MTTPPRPVPALSKVMLSSTMKNMEAVVKQFERYILLGISLIVLMQPAASGAATRPFRSRLDHRQAKLEAALKESIQDPAKYRCLRIDVQGFLGHGLRAVSVYGRGFGVWNRERQITLTRAQIRTCLKALETSHFTSMPDRIAGDEPEETRTSTKEKEGMEKNVTQLIRSVTLVVAGMTKTVEQDNKAPESEALKKMADAIVAVCRPAANKGVIAKDLRDGLQKIAKGTLAPELFRISINAPELRSLKSQDHQGWKLSIAYARLTVQKWTLQHGLGKPVHRWLSDDEIRNLAHTLEASGAASLPLNLNVPGYLQLSIGVLNRHRSIMARRYASRSAPQPDALHNFLKIRESFFNLFQSALAPRQPRSMTPRVER